MPHESKLAQLLRDDLTEARKRWLSKAKDDLQEYAQWQQSDFLVDTNHEGEVVDFHSLRHTCGAWLAMTGAHPKVVQQVMRHQSITLTMDTYGHLFPGQEADAVAPLRDMLVDHHSEPEALRATGTDSHAADSQQGAQRQAQRAGCETRRSAATGYDRQSVGQAEQKTPQPLQIADLGDGMLLRATHRESSGGGTRRGPVFCGKRTPFQSGWCKIWCSAGRSTLGHRSLASP